MKRILFIAIIAMVLVAGCSSPFSFGKEEAEPRAQSTFSNYTVPPNFIPQALLVTALGDSLSQGVGDEAGLGGYVGRLSQEMREWPGVRGTIVENTAKRGRRSDQLLAMFDTHRELEPSEQLAEPYAIAAVAESAAREDAMNLFMVWVAPYSAR